MKSNFEKIAMKVSIVSIVSNIVLTIFKLIAGVIANSSAMISDAVHSASDVFSTIVVIIGIRISSKESDEEHPYGHERMECVAALVLSTVLFITGLGIASKAFEILFSKNALNLVVPGRLAIVAALTSIILKEAMFWYTNINAKKIDSSALMADAWHHRSDSLSSIGALIGIVGSRMGFTIMDPLTSILICLFIAKASYDIFKDAINKMIDKSCDPEIESQIRDCVIKHDGVLGIDLLHTRVFGNKIYVDLEIIADGNKPLFETHAIAENVHDSIERDFPKVKHIMVHVNPK